MRLRDIDMESKNNEITWLKDQIIELQRQIDYTHIEKAQENFTPPSYASPLKNRTYTRTDSKGD